MAALPGSIMPSASASEFIVLAATLMEIKSRMMLARPPEAEEEDDLELDLFGEAPPAPPESSAGGPRLEDAAARLKDPPCDVRAVADETKHSCHGMRGKGGRWWTFCWTRVACSLSIVP